MNRKNETDPVTGVDSTAMEEADRKSDAATSGVSSEAEPMLYCPVCSKRLEESRCKLVCRQCGYFMSCADYY
jgi:hypothetical protein